MQVRSDAAEDAEGGFFTPPQRGAGMNQIALQKNNGNARFSDTDSDDLSIDTGKARPSRAGRADWINSVPGTTRDSLIAKFIQRC